MITINSGKLTIPEDERFIGFAGDNLHSTKQFLVENITDKDCTYRLYLEFDNGTVNHFVLDSKVENGSTILTWNVLEEHIFKSGIVIAQIKSMSKSGVTYHTTKDCFLVAPSAEFSEEFKNHENSEFLRYEKELNEIYDKINKTDLGSFVTTDTTIAGITLSSDITAEDLYVALNIYQPVLFEGPPTISHGPVGAFLIDTLHNDLYYCDKRTLSGYNWIKLTGASGSVSTDTKSLSQAQINNAGELVLTFSDGSTDNLGVIVGKDGDKGDDGYTPVKGVDYFDGEQGPKGDKGDTGNSVYISNTGESTEDGGRNVVIFNDGRTLTVRNGSKGSKGDAGYTPVKGVDYFTATDKEEIAQQIALDFGIDVSEYTKTMHGSYSPPNFGVEGYAKIGDYYLRTHSLLKTLYVCIAVTEYTEAINENEAFEYTWQEVGAQGPQGADGKTPVKGVDYFTDADKEELASQVITALGGTPVFGRVDENNNIILTGALAEGEYTLKYENDEGAITEICKLTISENEPTYVNYATPSSAEWLVNKRLNSSGSIVDTSVFANGGAVTNFIPCKTGDIIRVKGLNIAHYYVNESGQTGRTTAYFYGEDKSTIIAKNIPDDGNGWVYENGIWTYTVGTSLTSVSGDNSSIRYCRLTGIYYENCTANDVVITVNQEIN